MMIRREAPRRYAKALLQLHPVKEGLERREVDMKWIVDLLESDHHFRGFLLAPQITRKQKEDLIKKVFRGALDPVLLRFLLMLLHKGRIQLLPDIYQEYSTLLKEFMGITVAQVITACPLDITAVEKLKNKLKDMSKRAVQIEEKIDPKILGGAILILGNCMIDYSIKGRLDRMKESLLAARV